MFMNTKEISKIISLVIFVCLAMWSIRNLKDHDVSYATAILRQVIKTTVSKGLLYSTGGPCGAVHNSIDNWNNNAQCLLVDAHGDRPITNQILKANEDIYRDVFMKCKTRQQTKFDKLTQPKSSRTVPSLANEEKWVINLSSRTITSSEEEILKKGLGFAVSPRRIPLAPAPTISTKKRRLFN